MKTASRYVLVLVTLVLVSAPAEAQYRGGGGRPRGGRVGFDPDARAEMRDRMEMVRVCPVGAMWSILSFETELTDEKRAAFKTALAHAWTQRRHILAFGEEHKLWGEAKRKMANLEKGTVTQLKSMMEKDQWKAYEKALKFLNKQTRIQVPGRGR